MNPLRRLPSLSRRRIGLFGFCALLHPTLAQDPPTVTKVSPSYGSPGSILVITGGGFSPVPTSNRVKCAGVPAVVLYSTPFELCAVLPQGLIAGPTPVTVTVSNQTSGAVSLYVVGPETFSAAHTPEGLRLSWPADLPWQLESSTDLGQTTLWSPVTEVPAVQAGRATLVRPIDSSTRYFRLRAPAGTGPEPASASTGRAIIAAVTGGTVVTEDQAVTLVVPPGALAQDTEIAVSSIDMSDEGGVPAGDVILSPEGLTFSKPARLIIQTPPNPPPGRHLSVEILSGLNPPRNVGGEGTYSVPAINCVRTPDGRLEVPLDHFSVTSWGWWAQDLYAVLHLEGKYLLKGDLIYVLTGAELNQGGDWIPGHCGMYLGTEDYLSFNNDGEKIIEATTTNALYQGLVRFNNLSMGESSFKSEGKTHIYMGARRPTHFQISNGERSEIADWAIDKLGEPYALTGGPFLSNEVLAGRVDALWRGYSCVGLTELAYELGANKRIVPQISRLLLHPVRQFNRTSPVDSIELEVGEAFTVNVIGVVNTSARPFASDYYTTDTLYTRRLELALCSADALAAKAAARVEFIPEIGRLAFTPSSSDVGKDIRFALTVDGTQSNVGTETAFLTVTVIPALKQYTRKDPPTIQTFSVSGSLNPSAITVSAAAASILPAQGGTTPMRLTWDPPPQTLTPGTSFPMEIHADAGDNVPQITSSSSQPYLAAEINGTFFDWSQAPAFVGYQRQDLSNRFLLVTRSLNKTVSAGDTPSMVLEFRVFRASGPFNSGEVGARVIWEYQVVP